MSSASSSQQQQQNGKLMPNLDQQSTKVLNLTVLQRIDPFVEEILITAAHVTFYEFNIDLNQWSRKDVEGSLFVVKRNTQPRFQFIVMNRRNTENLVEDLLGDFEYEVQKPYLLYRNAAQEVNGIWFYNPHECEAIANLFSRILNAFSKVPSKEKGTSVKSEFEELEAVPNLGVMDGPLEPPSSSATTVSDVPDESFVNFFSAALNVGSAPGSTVPEQQPQPSFSASAPLLNPVQIAISTPLPSLPSSVPLPMSSSHMPLHDATESNSSVGSNRAANLLKPSFFAPPAASSSLMMPPVTPSSAPSSLPLQPPITFQRPLGTPLLQPFPPPTPSPSLTPASNYAPVITREKVRDALLRLAQNNQFVDMVYREILNAHYSQ